MEKLLERDYWRRCLIDEISRSIYCQEREEREQGGSIGWQVFLWNLVVIMVEYLRNDGLTPAITDLTSDDEKFAAATFFIHSIHKPIVEFVYSRKTCRSAYDAEKVILVAEVLKKTLDFALFPTRLLLTESELHAK